MKKRLNHDWKDYRMTLIENLANQKNILTMIEGLQDCPDWESRKSRRSIMDIKQIKKNHLNHDYKDYRMTLIANPANQGIHHGNPSIKKITVKTKGGNHAT